MLRGPLLTEVEVGCALRFDVEDDVALALQVAAVDADPDRESLRVELDGVPVDVSEVATAGGRVHVVRAGSGSLTVDYSASVPPLQGGTCTVVDAVELTRPSRYCPSDVLEPYARAELDGADGPAIGRWVHERLDYVLGASGPHDTAVDTLLAGRGVCRDFAHLTVALARGVGLPARLVAVYAPGLDPMDFHAVAEVRSEAGGWDVVDATGLAPVETLVRIATGRDAADTAFASTLSGAAELASSTVFARTAAA